MLELSAESVLIVFLQTCKWQGNIFFWLKKEWRNSLTVLPYLCCWCFHRSTHSSHSSLKFFPFLEILASDGLQASKIFLKETSDTTVKDIYKSQRRDTEATGIHSALSLLFCPKLQQSRYFESFWLSTKLRLNWRKPENNTLQR